MPQVIYSPPKPRLEQRRHQLNRSFETHEGRLPIFDCRYHFHQEIEIVAIQGSHGICIIDGQLERFQPGDVFLIASKSAHSFINRESDSLGSDWTRYVVAQFSPGFLGNNLSDCPEFAPIRELLREKTSFVLLGGLRKSVEKKMRSLRNLAPSNGLLLLLETLNEMALHRDLLRNFSKTQLGQASLDHDVERLARVHQFIHDHCTEDLTLAAVAECACMAPTSFSRYFRHQTGKTFQEYLAEVRILEVCSRLVLSDEPVTSICYSSGFNNLSNFNRQFKRVNGCTPSEFRDVWKQSAERPLLSDQPRILFENDVFRSTVM